MVAMRLRCGCDVDSKAAHMPLRKCLKVGEALDYDARARERAQLEGQPGFQVWFDKEGPRKDGDGAEPKVIRLRAT